MGKPFDTELQRVPDTVAWADSLDISIVAQFFCAAVGSPLITIGAGGSFTAAEMGRLVFESLGGFAVSHTPLSFLQNRSDLRAAYVLIITAAGNNKDVLAAVDAAVKREAKQILIICGASKSKVQKRLSDYERASLFVHDLPAGRDGYLATNSLAAFASVIAKATGFTLPSKQRIHEILAGSGAKWLPANVELSTAYFLPIYGDWGRPAAIDLESKFSEAGLGGVLHADFRNFAHGRHNWIDKQGSNTTVLAFLTPESSDLAKRTLQLLPPTTKVVKCVTEAPGATGAIELIFMGFALTSVAGSRRGIDPGRPGVPHFGSRLYQLGPLASARPKTPNGMRQAALSRKVTARFSRGGLPDQPILNALQEFVRRMCSAKFGAIVVDFDGTAAQAGIGSGALQPDVTTFFQNLLDHDVPIYFATGRGDSIHRIIEASFPRRSWKKIFISYYNGALTLPYSESSNFANLLPQDPALESIDSIIRDDAQLNSMAETRLKHGCQVTLKLRNCASTDHVTRVAQEIVAKSLHLNLRVVQSSHSIDIIPHNRSKLACINFAMDKIRNDRHVLAIGDRGASPGNDFDLLTHQFSLSVDTVSSDLNACWNLLPYGIRNTLGLIHYGSWIKVEPKFFRLLIPHEFEHE